MVLRTARQVTWGFCTLGVVLLGTQPNMALEQSQEEANPISVSMDVVPRQTLEGLPAAVVLTVTNRSSREAPGPWLNVPSHGARTWFRVSDKVAVTEERKEALPVYGWRNIFLCGMKPPRLGPGEKRVIKYWTRMPSAATGVVECVLWVQADPQDGTKSYSLKGGPVPVMVRKPKGKDIDALSIFEDRSIQALFGPSSPQTAVPPMAKAFPRPSSDQTLRRLEILVTEYGDTPYGKYGRYILACVKAGRAFADLPREKFGIVEAERASLREALAILQGLAAGEPPDNLRDEIVLQIASFSLCLGDVDTAQGQLDALADVSLPFPLNSQYRDLRAWAERERDPKIREH